MLCTQNIHNNTENNWFEILEAIYFGLAMEPRPIVVNQPFATTGTDLETSL